MANFDEKVQFPLDKAEPVIAFVRKADSIYHMELVNGANTFSVYSCNAMVQALKYIKDKYDSECEIHEDGMPPRALVVSNEGTVFSSGMDIESLFSSRDDSLNALIGYYKILYELITFPLPTIACINGHAFAAGLVFAMCFDFRVMREDRGYLCMNEVDMPAAIPPALITLLRNKVNSPQTLKKILLEGHKFTASEAKELSLIDEKVSKDKVLEYSFDIARKMSKKMKSSSEIFTQLRQELYWDSVLQFKNYDPGFLAKLPIPKPKL